MTPDLPALAPISLDEVLEESALQERTDRKYVVPRGTLDALLTRIAPSHRVLEIAGTRVQRYDTVYFDSPRLGAYHAHLQGRRRRYKSRTRLYRDTGYCVLELKLKDGRGRTVKERSPILEAEHGRLTSAMRAFLDERLGSAYGMQIPALEQTLHSRFQRITLVADGGGERVTCDLGVEYLAGRAWRPALDTAFAIIETKSPHGRGPAEAALKALGSRPVSVSKYCLGIGLNRPDVHAGRLLAPVRHYLAPAGA